ncbi:Uncharacterised protein [Clostridium perfringens]|uniref:Uncharacterized protein n=1 Tax=Clostridium perfringens TaxID=1502 RepID=A0A2X2Y232_CLOPF|nr:hypothetical protein [Clostridium perfringens]SQB59998.1 Uncharacterised protein [Clostridium perfringens]
MNSTEREIYDKYAYKKTHIYLVYEEFERRVNSTDSEYGGLKKGECSFNYSAWEKRLGISKKLLQNSIKQLVYDNVIIQTYKGGKGRGSSKYFLMRFNIDSMDNKMDNYLDNNLDNNLDNYKISNSNAFNDILDNKKDNYLDNKMDNTSIYNNLNIKSNNIYSSLENELDTKEIEKDLIKKINSKYSKDLIKEELEKLKDKDISKLDLLKELDKNLKSKSKDNSNQDINTIFDYWNSKGIIKHKELKEDTKKAIKKATKSYSIDEIKQAIDIYSEILNSGYYFTYKWSLKDFLSRNNGISTFMEEGSNRANYENWKKGDKRNGYTKGYTDKNRGRFTEGAEEIVYCPPKVECKSYTDEELERAGLI